MRFRVASIAVVALILAVNPANSQTAPSSPSARIESPAVATLKARALTGDAQAMMDLGRHYHEGRDIPQSYVYAHLYFNLAGAKGHPEAKAARFAVTALMTPHELERARAMAEGWPNSASPPPQAPVGPESRKEAFQPGALNGHYRWRLATIDNVCKGAGISRFLTIANGKIDGMFSHGADAGFGALLGTVNGNGEAVFYSNGQYVWVRFEGRFNPTRANGSFVVRGQYYCEGTWTAERAGAG